MVKYHKQSKCAHCGTINELIEFYEETGYVMQCVHCAYVNKVMPTICICEIADNEDIITFNNVKAQEIVDAWSGAAEIIKSYLDTM